MPSLNRAFPLIQMDAVAVLVREYLDFDMPRVDDEFLHEDSIIAEGVCGFPSCSFKALGDIFLAPGNSHAFSATACRSLDHHGKPDVSRDLDCFARAADFAQVTRNSRNTCLHGNLFRRDLVAHRLDRLKRRSDEGDVFRLERLSELRIFRQEAVTRMDGIRAGGKYCRQHLVYVDIRLACWRRTDADGLVSLPRMQ